MPDIVTSVTVLAGMHESTTDSWSGHISWPFSVTSIRTASLLVASILWMVKVADAPLFGCKDEQLCNWPKDCRPATVFRPVTNCKFTSMP
eukprot:365141-Chlamydomonas_euryale.AAC.1